MLLLGLTGSIATGKSTVSNILRSPPFSLPIIDADVIARQVVEPGTPGYQAIVSYFSPTTPDLLLSVDQCNGLEHGPSGQGRPLNRPALGRRVFGSDKDRERDRKKLGSIVHPAVRLEIFKQLALHYVQGAWAVVLDIPLLYESGWERLCGTILVVAVTDPEVQMKRLMDRDEHLSEADAHNRVTSQMDVREKAQRCLERGSNAGFVVWNDGHRDQLEAEVIRVMELIRRGSPRWWTLLLLMLPPVAVVSAAMSYVRSWLVEKEWQKQKAGRKAKI